MFLDITVLILFLLAWYKGWKNGLVLAVFSFLAFVLGAAAALKFSSLVAGWLGEHTRIGQHWIPVLAFVLVFLAVALWVRMGARAIEGLLNLAMLGWLNRVCGVLLYGLIYFFILSIVLFYAQQLRLVRPEALKVSLVYPFIEPLGPWIIDTLGRILPFFRNMFTQLKDFFGPV